jgi:hypothetical protein
MQECRSRMREHRVLGEPQRVCCAPSAQVVCLRGGQAGTPYRPGEVIRAEPFGGDPEVQG